MDHGLALIMLLSPTLVRLAIHSAPFNMNTQLSRNVMFLQLTVLFLSQVSFLMVFIIQNVVRL